MKYLHFVFVFSLGENYTLRVVKKVISKFSHS